MFGFLRSHLNRSTHRSRRRCDKRQRGKWQIQSLEPRLLLSSVSGRVWLDANINGIQDAAINGFESQFEDGIAGITVLLLDNNQAQIDSQASDANGLFDFTGLSVGDYYLKFATSATVDSQTMQLTFENALFGGNSLPTMDSDVSTLNGLSHVITLDGSNDVDDLAAGYAPIFDFTALSEAFTGQSYDFSSAFSLPDYLANATTATVNWSDGNQDSSPTITGPTYNNSQGDLKVTFDFDTYDHDLSDNSLFFDTQFKRDLMQYAASTVANKFGDTLTAITVSGSNTYSQLFNAPDDGLSQSITGFSLDTNEIYVYAGSNAQTSSTLGEGGPGGLGGSGSATFIQTLVTRGQSGIYNASGTEELPLAQQTDLSLWGGTITFNRTPQDGFSHELNWYFGLDSPSGAPNEADFLSVAMHEMMHVMGFGTATTWDNLKSGGTFTGPVTTAYYGSQITVGASHFLDGTNDPVTGQETAMDPSITSGTRKFPTGLDDAVMDDLGWDLLSAPSVSTDGTVQSSHSFDTQGTKTVTLTIRTDLGDLTYQVNVQVTKAVLQVATITPNGGGYDDGETSNAYFSQTMQRSVLQSIAVTFNRQIDAATITDFDLKLIRQDGTTYTPDLTSLNNPTSSDNLTWVIDLRPLSLDDGVYILSVYDTITDAATHAALDGDADGNAGGTYTSTRFHQLGGDFNGDGQYGVPDLSALANYWNQNDLNTPSYLDVNGDGNLNSDDMNSFAIWMEKLNLDVVEQTVQAVFASAPSTASDTLTAAIAAYENKQANLTLVNTSPSTASDTVTYVDIIGQWLM